MLTQSLNRVKKFHVAFFRGNKLRARTRVLTCAGSSIAGVAVETRASVASDQVLAESVTVAPAALSAFVNI